MTESMTEEPGMTEPGGGPWPALRRNLVAILRGVRPDEVVAIGEALVAAGFDAIEVPLNSPGPLDSIARLAGALPAAVLVGGGTVLGAAAVGEVHAAGGRLIVAPNTDPAVIGRAASLGMASLPGVFTPSEAFAALGAGASALKFFPASVLGAEGIAAVRAVLPRGAVLGVVGGVADAHFAAYAACGVTVFGLGSSLYRPGLDAAEVGARAAAAVAAYDAVFGAATGGVPGAVPGGVSGAGTTRA